MTEKINCVVCGNPIPKDRLKALKVLEVAPERLTCIQHSLDKRKQGIYLGEAGTSELLMVSKVYNDTVRSVFKSVEATKEGEETEYDKSELDYYTNAEEDTLEK